MLNQCIKTLVVGSLGIILGVSGFAAPAAAATPGGPVGHDSKKLTLASRASATDTSSRYLNKMSHIPQSVRGPIATSTLRMMSRARDIPVTEETASSLLAGKPEGMGSLTSVLRSLKAGDYQERKVAVDSSLKAESDQLRSHLVANINAGYPLALRVIERAGGLHLPGHPMNATIHSYLGVYGYSHGGDTVDYIDPSANAALVGWKQAKPYGEMSTRTTVELLEGGGYGFVPSI